MDFLLQLSRDLQPKLVRQEIAAQLEPVRLLDMHDAGDRQPTLRMHGPHAAETRGRDRAAVIGVLAADDEMPLGLLLQAPVTPDEPDDRVIGLGTRTGEKHMIELRRAHLAQLRRQRDRRWMRALKKAVVVRQYLELLADRIDDLCSTVAEVYAPETGHAVEDLITVRIPDVHTVRAGDDPAAALAELPEVGKWMQIMAAVELLPLARVLRFARTHPIFSTR